VTGRDHELTLPSTRRIVTRLTPDARPATAYGAAVALHSQPLELAWLREVIRTELSDAAYPPLVLRIGVVIQMAASVRRDPADVLSSSSDGPRFPAPATRRARLP
jgi:hypothetical protein